MHSVSLRDFPVAPEVGPRILKFELPIPGGIRLPDKKNYQIGEVPVLQMLRAGVKSTTSTNCRQACSRHHVASAGVHALPRASCVYANSNVARDRPILRRGTSAKIHCNLVDIAPSPAFRRIVALDDRVAGLVKMLGGVTVRRAVAAADMAAGPAEAQMHPRRTDLADTPHSRGRLG